MTIYTKLKLAIENIKNGVIIASDYQCDDKIVKQFQVLQNYAQVEKLFKKKDNSHYYEIFLENKKCNFIQDLDIKDQDGLDDPEQRLYDIIDKTKIYLKEYCEIQLIKNVKIECITLESPKTETKASYHIIYRISKNDINYYFHNFHIGCKNFYEWLIKEKKITLLGIDNIYTKNRCLRILGSSKLQFPENKLITKFNGDKLLTLGSFIDEKETDVVINNLSIKKPKKVEKEVVVEIEEINIDLIDGLLNCLDNNRAVDYNEWNKIGILLYCIYNGAVQGLDKFDKFSQRCPEKYDKQNIENHWENYSNVDKLMTLGSLHYFAKSDNPEMYKICCSNDYNNTNYLTGSHYDVAKLFFNKFSDTYIFNNESYYKFNKVSGIWVKENKTYEIRKSLIILSNEILKTLQKPIVSDEPEDNILNIQINLRNEQKKYIYNKLRTTNFQDFILKQIQMLMYIKETNFNNNPYLFAFNNCVYDFEHREFRKGKFEEYIIDTTGYNYQESSSDMANTFITDIIPNEDIRKYYLMIITSYMVAVHKREEFIVLYNKFGNNGKSTLMNCLDKVFGNYFYSCKSSILTEQKFENAEQASPTICNMSGKRFISFQEIKEKNVLESMMIKMLTGGDKINGRRLYEDTNEFYITGCIHLSCNDPPGFNKVDPAIIRRMRCIELETEFVENPTEPHHRIVRDILIDELKHSFFQLLLEHYNPDIKKGIKYCPQKIQDTTESYFLRKDDIRTLFSNNIITRENGILTKKNIEHFYDHCRNNKVINTDYKLYKLTKNEFLDRFNNIYGNFKDRLKIKGRNYYNCIQGIDLFINDNIDDDE